MSIESTRKWLCDKSTPNWVSATLGLAVVLAIVVTYFSAASAECLKVPRNEVVKYRSKFSDRVGPDFWNVSRELGNYWASVPSGVTGDAAQVAAGPADQQASDIAVSKSQERMTPKAPSAESRLLSIAMSG